MEYNLKTQIILGREDLRLFMEEKGDNELLDKTGSHGRNKCSSLQQSMAH